MIHYRSRKNGQKKPEDWNKNLPEFKLPPGALDWRTEGLIWVDPVSWDMSLPEWKGLDLKKPDNEK